MNTIASSSTSSSRAVHQRRPAAQNARRVAAKATAGSKDRAAAEAKSTRRGVVGLLAGAAALALNPAQPSLAAYGEAANVFGSKTGNFSGFTEYEGDGYNVLIPSKWNPSREKDFPGTDLRYEDNADAVNNLIVTITPTTKAKVSDYGSQDQFLQEFSFYLGQSSLDGGFESKSEGGFRANTIAAASVLEQHPKKDKNGREYYTYEILTRTADGDEGGRHQLISACVNKGNLYLIKIQAGDKRWFKGARKDCLGSWESFTVA